MCRCCYLIINVYRLQSYEEVAKECHLTRLNSVNGRIFQKKFFLRRFFARFGRVVEKSECLTIYVRVKFSGIKNLHESHDEIMGTL